MAKRHFMIENSVVNMWKMLIYFIQTRQNFTQDNIGHIGFQVQLKKIWKIIVLKLNSTFLN